MTAARSLLLLSIAPGALGAAPTGLMVDFQLPPSLGVRGADALQGPPAFTWIVPPCATAPDAAQTAYQIVVTREGQPFWDSSKTAGADSTYVAYAGPALSPSTHSFFAGSAPSSSSHTVDSAPAGRSASAAAQTVSATIASDSV